MDQAVTAGVMDPHAGAAPARAIHHRNNFDALRLLAAFIVIYGHGRDLIDGTEPGLWNGPIAKLGLDIFFSVSGYLVTRSWDRNPDAAGFALRRGLRLMPGLAVCVLLIACVLGPVVTRLPLGQYLLHARSWSYLANIALYLQLFLPGVFETLPRGSAVNGSLWSLFPEVLCYCTVPFVATLRPRPRRLVLLAGGCAAGAMALYLIQAPDAPAVEFYSLYVSYGLQEVPFFFVGALLSLIDRGRPGFYRLLPAALLFAAGCWLALVVTWRSVPLEWFVLPYLVIGIGIRSTPVLSRADTAGDLSYGLYLYAFPVQQLVLYYLPHLAHPLAACVLLTLPLAWLSWHLVEQPALLARARLDRCLPAIRRAVGDGDAWVLECLRRAPGLWRTPVLPLAAGAVILLVYAGQLQMGRWQGDEYTMLTEQRHWGWHILPLRLRQSPHPFSEALLFAYDWVVLRLRLPLVAPFLGAVWIGTLAACAAALWSALPRGPWRAVVAVAVPLSLFGFVLVTGEVTEFFFWPVATAAYMPTAGAALMLLFLLSGPNGTGRDIACGLALLVAATASAMGAAFAVSFGAAALGETILSVRAARRGGAPVSMARQAAGLLWWLLPALAGLIVLLRVTHGWSLPAPGAAVPRLLGDLLGLGIASGGFALLWALGLKVMLAAGVVGVWAWAAPGGVRLRRFGPVLVAGLLGAALFSVWSAPMPGGAPCCERQDTTRFWMTDIVLIVVMIRLMPQGPTLRGRRARWLSPVLLTLALCPVLWRIGGLREDYANLHFAREARNRTWFSAATTAPTQPMQFYLPPDGASLLIRGTPQSVGRSVVGHDAPGMVDAVGRFFDHEVIDVCESWQTSQSWLYYGRFIPACPPHDGPPDRIYPDPVPAK